MTDTTILGLNELVVIPDDQDGYIPYRRIGQDIDEKVEKNTLVSYVQSQTSITEPDGFDSTITLLDGMVVSYRASDQMFYPRVFTAGEVNTASNLGDDSIGGGVYNSKNGVDLRFNRIVSGGDGVTVTGGGNSGNIVITVGEQFSGDYNDLINKPNLQDLAFLDTVGTSQIDSQSVTYAKIQQVSPSVFLGNATGTAATVAEIDVATAQNLLNVQDGATANQTDAFLRARGNHTGTQLLSTISDAGTMAAQNANAVNITGGTISGISLVGINQTTITPVVKTASSVALATDAGKAVLMDVNSANTYTIPPNSSVNFPPGTFIVVYWQGTGQTTIVAGTDVTILKPSDQTLKINKRYDVAYLYQSQPNVWNLTGAMELV